METIQNDVKEGAASSAAVADVKEPTTLDQVTEKFYQESQAAEQGGKEAADVPADEEASEGAGQETTKTEAEQTTTEVAAEEADPSAGEPVVEADGEKKTEEAVPYDRFKEVNERAKQYEPLAVAQSQLQDYCIQNNITPTEFQEALSILALKKQNPAEAAKRLLSMAETIEVSNGSKLPADLQQEVADGTLSEARAKELARLRIEKNAVVQTSQQTIEQQQQRYVAEMSNGLINWAATKAKTDTSFKPKANDKAADGKFEDFVARFHYRSSQKMPQSMQDVINLAEQAYEDVNAMARRYMPKAAKKKVLTNSSVATTITSPKSMDDVVENFAREKGIR